MMIKPLPCRCCGWVPETEDDFEERHDAYGMTQKRTRHACMEFGAQTRWHNTRQGAIREWNGLVGQR